MGDVTTSTMSNFKWITDKEMEELDMIMVPDDSAKAYILERD